jgi:hypothetical protein
MGTRKEIERVRDEAMADLAFWEPKLLDRERIFERAQRKVIDARDAVYSARERLMTAEAILAMETPKGTL